MPQIQIGRSSYERAKGDMADLPVINMYVEPSESEGVVLQSRPALVDRGTNMGSGPVLALFSADGVLGGDLLGISGNTLYRGTTTIGTIPGSGVARLSGSELGIMATRGEGLYYYNGSTLAQVAFPDNADVVDVFVGGSRFWAIRKDTGRIYWTDVLETNVDALDFATAESFPDRLLQGLWIDGMPILFGAESIEFWQQTRSAQPPIAPLQNLVIEKGIKNTGAACEFNDTFAAVTDDNTVIFGMQGERISNPGLQERIAESSEAYLFTYRIDGASFLAIRLDTETHAFDNRTGSWSKLESYGHSNWLPRCRAGGVFGSAIDGRLFAFSDGFAELGGVLERRFRGGLPINGGGVNIDNLRLRPNPGHTPFLTGTYADAKVEMRTSRDAGQTWGPWIATTLGRQGRYNERVEWRALGMFSQPGFLVEFRVTDPVPFRVSGAFVNEPYGGRA